MPIDFHDIVKVISYDNKNTGFQIQYEDKLPRIYSKELKPYFLEDAKIKENILFKTHIWFLKWGEKYIKQLYLDHKNKSKLLTKLNLLKNINLKVVKQIPSPTGLGGGSSNAASFLKGLFELFSQFFEDSENSQDIFENSLASLQLGKLKKPDKQKAFKQLEKDAITLGADIPFFFKNQPAFITGIGDIQKYIEFPPLTDIMGILGIPPYGFDTSMVYQAVNFSLQDKNKNFNSHKLYFSSLISIIEAILQGRQHISSLKIDKIEEIKRVAEQTAEGVFYVKNDLFEVLNKILPDKAKRLTQAMLDVATTMSNLIDHPDSVVCYSMSGSGSSFYALTNSYPNVFENVLNYLKQKYPDIYWRSFCVV